MLCSKLKILSSLILYVSLEEGAAEKSKMVATKSKKQIIQSEKSFQESENYFNLGQLDNFFFRPLASTEGPNTGSQPENKREECSCGKQYKQFKNEISGQQREISGKQSEISGEQSEISGEQSEISGGEEAQLNEFPWAVRIFGGCAQGLCGGALISPRIILSAYHCAVALGSRNTKLCDHSDGRRKAILGQHKIDFQKLWKYTVISITQVKSPPNGRLTGRYNSHDFALFIMERRVRFDDTISPICLPQRNEEFGGENAVAAGWGRFDKPKVNTEQSPVLRKVWLTVSNKKYRHKKMFGTIVSQIDNQYQDPCSGDSGGPLMYYNKASAAFTIIGTVNGNGYDCRTNQVNMFEGSRNGLWNKVSAHMGWIQDTMDYYGERVCKDD